MNSLEEQATKAKEILKAMGLEVTLESGDEFYHSIDFSNWVTLYLTKMNPTAPVFYTVGYWDENVQFVAEFSDNTDLLMSMEQVLILPTMWANHKKIEGVINHLYGGM